MKIIKNYKELKKLVNKHNDLILPNENVRIEFEPTEEEIRNIECKNLSLEDDDQNFNFNGGNFNGGKISYYAFFICYGNCEYTEIEGQRKNSFHKCLDGEFIKKEDDTVEITVEGNTKRISRQSAKELNLL
jgi:hypothetical protein